MIWWLDYLSSLIISFDNEFYDRMVSSYDVIAPDWDKIVFVVIWQFSLHMKTFR